MGYRRAAVFMGSSEKAGKPLSAVPKAALAWVSYHGGVKILDLYTLCDDFVGSGGQG
jgi:hypothetical protein